RTWTMNSVIGPWPISRWPWLCASPSTIIASNSATAAITASTAAPSCPIRSAGYGAIRRPPPRANRLGARSASEEDADLASASGSPSKMNNRSLGIFAKEPRPGHVKSRLASASSPEWAAKVADALLRDTVARLAKIEASRFLVYSPNQAKGYFAALAAHQYQLISQGGGDLGRRIEQFIIGQRQTGARHIMIVGADSPTMPPEWIEQAFQDLEQADLVIGPATD